MSYNFSRGGFRRGRQLKRNGFSYQQGGFRHGKNRSLDGVGLDINRFIHKAADTPVVESYTPRNSFDGFGLSPQIVRNIASKGYVSPTPIQDQSIPPILESRDLIGLANTGTGKTAAFLLPMIDKVFKNRNERVFIIAPTRELALQIDEELRVFAQNLGIYSSLLIGGASLNRQIQELYRKPQFVIGTPGRIKDLIKRNYLNLSNFGNIILDEVDLMVDIGFIRDVQYFISLLSSTRQSLFFSATISAKVNHILQSFVRNPVTVSVKTGETTDLVDQDVVHILDKNKKVDQLHQLLIQKGFDRVLVFGATKWNVERLTRELVGRGFRAAAIHGNKTQGARLRVVQEFKQGRIQVLLATDIASRGLDIPDVTHVINYELPKTYEHYIHRIGRTGRANKRGVALTFV
ncbi:MAG: DEAD/DEAH box helicase [Candidatus Blackburnbacteria bacterium]|nr:DEAD/DEAH box helicase [Candidatus Blackburnbacteria bacterium]